MSRRGPIVSLTDWYMMKTLEQARINPAGVLDLPERTVAAPVDDCTCGWFPNCSWECARVHDECRPYPGRGGPGL